MGGKFINKSCLVPNLFSEMHFEFHAWEFDDVITFDYWKVKIWSYQEPKELLKWNKNHFSLFHKCCLLDLQKQAGNLQSSLKEWAVKYGYAGQCVNDLLIILNESWHSLPKDSRT